MKPSRFRETAEDMRRLAMESADPSRQAQFNRIAALWDKISTAAERAKRDA